MNLFNLHRTWNWLRDITKIEHGEVLVMLWSTHVVWLTWLINVCFCVESSPIIVYISQKVMVVVLMLLLLWLVSAQFVFPLLSKVRRKSALNLLLQSTFSESWIPQKSIQTRAQHLFNSRVWKIFFTFLWVNLVQENCPRFLFLFRKRSHHFCQKQ